MSMSPAQLAAVSYLARYSGHTHELYIYQLRRWFAWCQANGLDALDGIQRAHVELYIRQLGASGLMDSSVNTMMHGVRGFFRFALIDGIIPADPAVYARLPKVHHDESRTHGLDRLELIRFLQVAQTINVHHGALAYLLGINALRASEAAAVRIEDYAETLRGHRVLHLLDPRSGPVTHTGCDDRRLPARHHRRAHGRRQHRGRRADRRRPGGGRPQGPRVRHRLRHHRAVTAGLQHRSARPRPADRPVRPGPPGGQGGAPRRFLQIDEEILQAVTDITGGQYFRAEDAAQLDDAFRRLPSEVVHQDEDVELTVCSVPFAALLATAAIGLSLWWNRHP